MTQREKLLAIGVGAALGGLALVTVVRWVVVQPFETVQRQIQAEQKRRQRLNQDLAELSRVDREWQALTARTFALDPKEAQRRFREDLQQLLERHRLRETKITPGSPTRYKDGSIGVPLTINATATLNEIVGFLCDFYRRDYLARLEKVRITADQSVVANYNTTTPGRARPAPAPAAPRGRVRSADASRPRPTTFAPEIGPDGPELKLNISAVTLVLPKLKDVEHPVMEEVVELESGRLGRRLEEYSAIFERNLFMPYREKPAIVEAPAGTQPAPPVALAERPPPPPPPPPPVRPGAELKFVRGTTRLNGALIAYVVDEGQTEQPVTAYRHDDPIDDGTVLLILPQGVVVRVEEPGGHEVDYFYPLGKSFIEREAINPDDHPELVAAIQAAFVQ